MRKAIVLLLFLYFSANGLCATLPADYPQAVLHEGNVDVIDLDRSSVVIADRQFYFTPATQFYRPDGITASFADLRIGQRVGCNYAKQNGRRALAKVWILPKGASFRK